jgi:hypothetical protein
VTRALEKNWVITFPQGNDEALCAGKKRNGIDHKTSKTNCNTSCDQWIRKGRLIKRACGCVKKGTVLKVKFKEPLVIDYDKRPEDILADIMDAIEQSKKFMVTVKHEENDTG